jgi:hypothetical protein
MPNRSLVVTPNPQKKTAPSVRYCQLHKTTVATSACVSFIESEQKDRETTTDHRFFASLGKTVHIKSLVDAQFKTEVYFL